MREAGFEGSEGAIHYRVWEPGPPVRRIILIVHGYAEHGGRYAHVGEALAAAGAAVYAPDHIGHGQSDGERALITDFEHVVDDLRSLLDIARAGHPGVPVIVFGHSMGGLLSARLAERHPADVAGVGFLGAVIGNWDWARRVLALPELPSEPSDPSGMTRDGEAARGYAEDPLVYHGPYKRPLLEAEVVALDRFNDDIDKLTMPVLFLHGEADPFVPYATSREAVHRMPSFDVRIKVYPGARHELVNETNRDEVLAELAAFAARVAP